MLSQPITLMACHRVKICDEKADMKLSKMPPFADLLILEVTSAPNSVSESFQKMEFSPVIIWP